MIFVVPPQASTLLTNASMVAIDGCVVAKDEELLIIGVLEPAKMGITAVMTKKVANNKHDFLFFIFLFL
jgi:hypothetical protein